MNDASGKYKGIHSLFLSLMRISGLGMLKFNHLQTYNSGLTHKSVGRFIIDKT